MEKETKEANYDLCYIDTKVNLSTDDPLQDYYSTLHSGSTIIKTSGEHEGIKIKGHKLPDPRKHQIISFIKSAIRIGGYIAIPFNLELAALILILSEMVGVAEELV